MALSIAVEFVGSDSLACDKLGYAKLEVSRADDDDGMVEDDKPGMAAKEDRVGLSNGVLGIGKPRSPDEFDASNMFAGKEVLRDVVVCDTPNELPMPMSLNPKFSGEVAVRVDEEV